MILVKCPRLRLFFFFLQFTLQREKKQATGCKSKEESFKKKKSVLPSKQLSPQSAAWVVRCISTLEFCRVDMQWCPKIGGFLLGGVNKTSPLTKRRSGWWWLEEVYFTSKRANEIWQQKKKSAPLILKFVLEKISQTLLLIVSYTKSLPGLKD